MEMDLTDEEVKKYKGMSAKDIGKVLDVGDLYKNYLLKSAAQGAANVATGGLNLIPGLQKKVGRPDRPFKLNIQENPEPVAEMLGGVLTPMPGGPLLRAAGKYGPGILKQGANLAMKGGQKLSSLLSGKNPGMARTIGAEAVKRGGQGALTASALGETLRPEETEQYENLPMNAGLGMLFGGTLGGASGVIPGAGNRFLNKMNEANELAPRLTRSPSQVKEISEELPGNIRVNLAELVKSPKEQKYYSDVLSHTPFSGVQKEERRALNEATGQTEDFLGGLLGKTHPANAKKELGAEIRGTASKNLQEARKLYKLAAEEGKSAGFSLKNTPNASEGIKKILEKEDKSWLKSLSEKDMKDLSDLGGLPSALIAGGRPAGGLGKEAQKQILRESGKSIEREPLSLMRAKNLRSRLLKEARKADSVMEDAKAKALNKVVGLLDKDIDTEIKRTGSKNLEKYWTNANKHYKEEYVPYGKDKYIREVIKGTKGIMPSKIAKEEKFEKVFKDLSPEGKNLLGYSMLDKAVKSEGERMGARPIDLARRQEALSPDLLEKLFTPEQRKSLGIQKALSQATESGQRKNAHTGISPEVLEKFAPTSAYSDIKKLGLGALHSLTGNTQAKIMSSPAVRNAYVKGEKFKGQKSKELMKEFKVLNKAKYLANPLEKSLYYWQGGI